MNKTELVAAVAASCQMTKVDAERAIDATFEAITESLKQGDEVRLIGFGSFVVADRKATEGRNPRTGEKIQIKATRVPKFKPGKGLKDAVAL
ncbi:MAG TPA: HU family DNA-binding protein [Alphaproteobacteria bacterium]|nr:HU family DNA-binding protein [Alphaproteobacteria bacterium]